MNLTEREVVHSHPLESFDDENRAKYQRAIERAIQTGDARGGRAGQR